MGIRRRPGWASGLGEAEVGVEVEVGVVEAGFVQLDGVFVLVQGAGIVGAFDHQLFGGLFDDFDGGQFAAGVFVVYEGSFLDVFPGDYRPFAEVIVDAGVGWTVVYVYDEVGPVFHTGSFYKNNDSDGDSNAGLLVYVNKNF